MISGLISGHKALVRNFQNHDFRCISPSLFSKLSYSLEIGIVRTRRRFYNGRLGNNIFRKWKNTHTHTHTQKKQQKKTTQKHTHTHTHTHEKKQKTTKCKKIKAGEGLSSYLVVTKSYNNGQDCSVPVRYQLETWDKILSQG